MDSAVRQIHVKSIEAGDLESVVAIHRAAFHRSALSRLGEGSARRYYLWQLTGRHKEPDRLAWVGEARAGFLVGGIFQGATSGFLRKNKWYLMLRLLGHPWLLVDGRFRQKVRSAYRILLRFLKLRPPKPAAPKVSKPPQFSVLAVAVHPDFQRSGVGNQLMRTAEQCAREGGWGRAALDSRAAE